MLISRERGSSRREGVDPVRREVHLLSKMKEGLVVDIDKYIVGMYETN